MTARPSRWLASPAALSSVIVIVANDLWLKRHHPGVLSGKLSDLGLCVFLPLFLGAAMAAVADVLGKAPNDARRAQVLRVAACLVAALYFAAVKCVPWATHAHVAWLSSVMPTWHFRAVTDPTDLVCLPAMWLAWRTMAPGATTSPAVDPGTPAAGRAFS